MHFNIKTTLLIFPLSLVMILFLAPQANASIKVEGSREFRDEVNECLSTYRNNPGIVGDVIKELERSGNEHKIENRADWDNAVNNQENAFNGNGTGTVIGVDKGELERLKGSVPELANKDFCSALLHELYHAVDADRGEWSNDTEGGVLEDEIEATMFQNFIHAIRGVDPRTAYGGTDISAIVLRGDDPVEEVEEEPAEEPKEEPKTTEKISVIQFGGMYIPISGLKVYTKEECNCCDSDHYHAPAGSVKSVDGKTVTDPYSNCGLGKVSNTTTIEK